MGEKKLLEQGKFFVFAACLLLALINVLGDSLSIYFSLPIWLDSFGTMVAGYFFGPIAGGAVGFVSHLMICVKDQSGTVVYALANMSVGIVVALSKKRGRLNDLFGFCNVAILLALISILISVPDTLILKGGVIGNRWGNEIVTTLREFGMSKFWGTIFAEFYVDFVDKTILMYTLYLGLAFYRRIKCHESVPINFMNLFTFIVLPLIGFEGVVRHVFRGEFRDSIYFKNYMIMIFALIMGWFVCFIMIGFQRKRELRQQNEIALLKQKNALIKNTVMTIARMVDAKDIYTAKHSARVTKYSLMIGKKLGLSDEEMENLERSALLHDIGKVAIPDGILSKKGKLSKEEYQIMKSHPVFGYDILKDMDSAPQISEGALYHHERYDGKGYPTGLKGEEIPLFGRIIGVADAYDAMSSNRIYRPKCDDAYILSEFKKNRGIQFDPKICDIFIELLESKQIEAEKADDKMTLERAYERFGGRYVVIQQRLKKDERIRSHLSAFLEDPEFEHLSKALDEGDDRTAFQAVHALKGLAMNLEMENLAKLCIALTENLRNAPINAQTPELFEQLRKEYTEVCDIIGQLDK